MLISRRPTSVAGRPGILIPGLLFWYSNKNPMNISSI
jgi:hypothetical protein